MDFSTPGETWADSAEIVPPTSSWADEPTQTAAPLAPVAAGFAAPANEDWTQQVQYNSLRILWILLSQGAWFSVWIFKKKIIF